MKIPSANFLFQVDACSPPNIALTYNPLTQKGESAGSICQHQHWGSY